MIDVDKEKIGGLIKWWTETDTQGIDIKKYFINPVMEYLGDDEDEIKKYLFSMKIDDLACISGAFEYIYGKFMNDDMYTFLYSLESKVKKYNEGIH